MKGLSLVNISNGPLFSKSINEFIGGKTQTIDEIDFDMINARQHVKYLIGVDLVVIKAIRREQQVIWH